MKFLKVIMLFAVCVLLCACAVGCADEPEEQAPVFYTVTFDPNGGSQVGAIRVQKGKSAAEPAQPVREGYIFEGWTKDLVVWNFDNAVNDNMLLKAKWTDAANVYQTVKNSDGTCTVTGAKKTYSIMSIPSKIDGYTVTAVADGAFSNYMSKTVEKIIIPESVVSVGKEAFSDGGSVEIQINGKLEFVGESAFLGCAGLRSVSFSDRLSSIAPQAFSGCTSLVEIRLPESLTVIDENAFEECTSLSRVIMHHTVESVADGAFIGCDALRGVCFIGTREQFDAINIANGNQMLISANLYLYSESEPSTDGDFWYYDKNSNVKIW